MSPYHSAYFASPRLLSLAIAGSAACALVVFLRRPRLPRPSLLFLAAGLLLLCVAAGEPVWQRPSPGEIAVMVDLSPSTRKADFRTHVNLERRIRSLLGKTPYRVYAFSSNDLRPLPAGETLADLPAERTVFSPPPGARGVVLFSDGRFDLPEAAPPTYVVIDPLLESPADASVASLQIHGRDVFARVNNSGAPRRLALAGTMDSSPADVPSGPTAIVRPHDPKASGISARLSPGDAWPENDQLIAMPSPPSHLEQWWVGASPPGRGWRALTPAELPTDAAGYLIPSVIVLENVSANDLSPLRQARLGQYVRALGGGLVILGGDHAFAAGAYSGSEIESLSPLASTPPRPTTHWILLADGSGSMNQSRGGISLWHHATDAITRLIPHLPPEDTLSIGSFAETLTWWTTGKTVRETAGLSLPPANVLPHGPTNLEDALLNTVKGLAGDESRQLLLLSDADAEIKDPVGLEALLRQKNVHLHLLAIENGSAIPTLRPIIRNTGGTLIRELDPQKWADAIQSLMQAAAPKLLGTRPLAVHFVGDLSALASTEAFPWNRTWLKGSATLLGIGGEGETSAAAVAQWNAGEGRVLASAFDAGAAAADAFAAAVRQPPHDPRYHVTWESAALLRVSVDAVDGKTCLNGKTVRLELSPEAENIFAVEEHDVPQTGPGRYALELPAPRSAAFATLRVEGRVVDRVAVAGRYAPEFDEVGNDHLAMEALARRTGGEVVAPRQIWPIEFHWPGKSMALTSIFAIVGSASMALGLGWWKWAA